MENLKLFTSNFADLTEKEFTDLEALFQPMNIKKMDHVLAMGTYVKDLYFFDRGTFRVYHLKDGEEFTTKFLFSPCIYAELFSIRNLTPTFFNIQALTPCDCYKANFREIEKLVEKSPNVGRLFLKLYEHIYMKGKKREISFILDSQTKRYNNLIAENPQILEEIPLQYIASYIGVKPETLSRIRKKNSDI
ncbi:MAG: Crp/Fnr family transcriptional regulator [Flavobacterium sp. BFFFF1]|uniref:Crp/Fnr family transcriptional regulator n=1 Tax=Flavobacterium sp. BFFFF1 TaxID=2015557 RepID=UPI000BC3CB61|nr:Crp/Fnr family transcriptional regulator [Flavobacterium sp. BFFFF1]OYU79459.1 MAG: Crp/Fnr family transcriptional regulator [Flavobacterium sp. BFFFF1]